MSRFKTTSVKLIIGSSVVLGIAGVALAELWRPSVSEQENAITVGEQEGDIFGTLPRDRSKPVATKAEIVAAWQKRQDAVKTASFAWVEQQTHPKGWLGNPRFPERERAAIPALREDRNYSVSKTLAVDGDKMRYTLELDRAQEPGLGVGRHYWYVSVFDGRVGRTYLSSMTNSPPAIVRSVATSEDAQNLDTRALLMALRPLHPVMGHLLVERAMPNQGRVFYKGRSTMIIEERHDPSGWKTSLWIEPERDFLVSRYRVAFEQMFMVDIDIDYISDPRWGWIPSGWRVSEMLADGSVRQVAEARVSSYSINQPIRIEEVK
jgi:hypothetical protein